MKRILFIICACLCSACIIAQTPKKKVAVYVSGDVESAYKKIISSKLVSGITNSDSYAAVERTADFLSVLNQEKDYQTSGEVSDNQIVKLGQQFGVRYVFVADVSELFESIFVSARMIDVQTGQITASTEASQQVASMDQLIALSSSVVTGIMEATDIPTWDVKAIGPFGTNKELFYFEIPEGYKQVSEEDFLILVKHGRADYPAYIEVSKVLNENYYNEYWNKHKVVYTLLKSEKDKSREESIFYTLKKDGGTGNDNIITIPSAYMYVIKK